MTDTAIFEFERDFASSLRCIPMAVRLKLDLCRVKLSLRQWSRFTTDDRRMLLETPGETPAQIAAYRRVVVDLVAARAGEPAKDLAEDVTATEWEDGRRAPPALNGYARSVGLPDLSPAQWAALTALQRFALIKLSRDHHDNINFVPAMHEFGLVHGEAA